MEKNSRVLFYSLTEFQTTKYVSDDKAIRKISINVLYYSYFQGP